MHVAYTPINWSMSIELHSQVCEKHVIIKSLCLKVCLKLSTIIWTLMFFGIQLNYTDVFTDEYWLYQLPWRARLLTGGCAIPSFLQSKNTMHFTCWKVSNANPSLALLCDTLPTTVTLFANQPFLHDSHGLTTAGGSTLFTWICWRWEGQQEWRSTMGRVCSGEESTASLKAR